MNKKGRPLSKKVEIDPILFKAILKNKDLSIRKLGYLNICNEKTVRNALKNKKMTEDLLNKIARNIDVDPNYLSGNVIQNKNILANEKKKIKNKIEKNEIPIKNYPLLQEEVNKARKNTSNIIYNILPLFGLVSKQYDELPKDKKYNFVDEILKSLYPIIQKYFTEDANGKPIFSEAIYADNLVNDWIEFEESLDILSELKSEYKDINLPPQIISILNRKKIKYLTDSEILDMFFHGYFNN